MIATIGIDWLGVAAHACGIPRACVFTAEAHVSEYNDGCVLLRATAVRQGKIVDIETTVHVSVHGGTACR
jgi:hypothetical protein